MFQGCSIFSYSFLPVVYPQVCSLCLHLRCVHAKSLQLCLTLCDPIDCGLPGSSVHGILQARVLEWIDMPSSRGSSQPRDQTHIGYVSSIVGWFFTTSTTWEAPTSLFNSVQLLSHVPLFATPWTAARQASLSVTNSQSPPKPMSIASVMPSNHLILCHPLFCPQSFPASGFFQMSQLFTSGGQSIGVSASASILPMNTQDWSPLSADWISLQSKGLSRVFSNTTVQNHQFFGAQLSL